MIKKPEWIRVKLQGEGKFAKVDGLLAELSLNTVCKEANCPNRMECFNKGTATFMILGRNCTRNCTFCNVTKALPQEVDREEPRKITEAVKHLGIKHVVITSVTRDDLKDGGAMHFSDVVKSLKENCTGITVEVLIPDFQGDEGSLKIVLDSGPEILNHNVETVPSLYEKVRPMADYQRSLNLLRNSKKVNHSVMTKSGMMLGFGETKVEVKSVMNDLRNVGCDVLTIGQYLRPSTKHIEVYEYVHPDIFKEYEETGYEMGFKYVASSPLVRSSYNAAKALE